MTREVVLLNGWGMTSAAWQSLRSALPSRYRLHAIDLHELEAGRSGSVEDLAATAAARAPGRCDVIAWSLGAQIALQWAHDRPSQVGCAVLIAGTPCFVAKRDWPAGMEVTVFEAFAEQVRSDPRGALNRFALLQARGDANMTAVARALRAALAESRPALAKGLACLRDTDLRGLVPRVKQPLLLAHGARDAIVPIAAAERLCGDLPDARLHVYSGAGHAPHLSQPALSAASIAEFFDEQ
jgi:pimeloyl-[acyl-carrier protein] methyl ester esterase